MNKKDSTTATTDISTTTTDISPPSLPAVGDVVLSTENGVTSPAVVTGANADGTLALHVIQRTGVAGTVDFDSAPAAVDGGAGWSRR